jgi:2,3-bisphosphoglycerate-dependent phosphoglycerate mutase
MKQIVIMRHGESFWNLENRFTGWADVELDDEGHFEALRAGHDMRKLGFHFDVVFTSILKRAIHTAQFALDIMDQVYVPMIKDWRLNERHYGALQGLNKADMASKYGEHQVFEWRRSYDLPPPPLTDAEYAKFLADPKYSSVPPSEHPRVETLKVVVDRVVPYWTEAIMTVARTKSVLVVAHGNSLRAILKYIENISEEDIPLLNLPTGVPILLKFDDNWKYLGREYIGDQAEIAKSIAKVQAQGHAHP